jgi:hypothetical protein
MACSAIRVAIIIGILAVAEGTLEIPRFPMNFIEFCIPSAQAIKNESVR